MGFSTPPFICTLSAASTAFGSLFLIGSVSHAQPGPGAVPNPQVAEAPSPTVKLTLPENLELGLLIKYVSDRLMLNVVYDQSIAQRRVTLQTPAEVPVSSLRSLLETVLRTQGLVLVESDQKGLLRIVELTNLSEVAAPQAEGDEGGGAKIVTAVLKIEHADPGQVEQLLRPFLTKPGGTMVRVPSQPLLVVTDFATTIEQLRKMAELSDQAPPESVIEFAKIEHMDAVEVAQELTRLLQARDETTGGSTAQAARVRIEAESRTNRLVLIGPQALVDGAKQLLQRVDIDLGLTTKLYALDTAAPARIDAIARELIGPNQTQRLYRSSVDQSGNILIVATTDANHAVLADLKRQFDLAPDESKSPIRFYKLANADAADVLATIRAIEGGGDIAGFTVGPTSSTTTTAERVGGAADPLDQAAIDREQLVTIPDDLRPGRIGRENRDTEPASATRRRVDVFQGPGATVTADPTTNSIIVAADAATQQVYERLIEMLDRRRPQVLIEVTLVSIDTSDDYSLAVDIGADSTFTALGGGRTVTFSSFGVSQADPDTGGLSILPGVGFNGAVLVPEIADVVVRALQSNRRAKIVSAPRVLVNDNATGVLSSITEQPTLAINAGETVSTTTFAGFASAGTDIEVTPTIAEGDHLKLDFNIVVSAFQGEGANGIPAPRSTNEVSSQATVPDGSMIVVGGINRDDFATGIDKVPLLGDIPLLGRLFQSRFRTNSQSTLFVFIRPVILRDDEFRDLKYLSGQDASAAEMPADFPSNEPLLME